MRFMILAILGAMTLFAMSQAHADTQPGDMIDKMMAKQAEGGVVTAESLLPAADAQKAPENIDDAVKVAMATNAKQASKSAADMTMAAKDGAEKEAGVKEENQPVFNNPKLQIKDKPANTTNLWGRMAMSLAIVLVMVGGGAYAFRKWPGSKKIVGRARMIEVLSQHHLGPKKSLAVVRVAGETCLIGVTDNNISILKTLSLLDEDLPRQTAAPEAPKAKGFTQALVGKLTRAQNIKAQAQTAAPVDEVTDEVVIKKTTAPNPAAAAYNRKGKPSAAGTGEAGEDDYALEGLREIVGQRLKTMREL